MQLPSTRIKIVKTIVWAALTLMFSACINENSLCPEDTSNEEGVTFEFSMVTRKADSDSRALQPPTGSTQVGFAAENYLDLDNLLFLLFDDNQTLLRVFIPEVEPVDIGTYVKYRVRAFLTEKYFFDSEKDNITFTIVVLGNYAGLAPLAFNYNIGQKLSEVFDMAKVATFASPVSNNNDNNWQPSIFPDAQNNGQLAGHIPMAGMQTFNVSTAAIKGSTVDHPLLISPEDGNKDINMLRALAKIEVVDKSGDITNSGRSRIAAIELIGKTTRGSIVPTLNQWQKDNSNESQYVSAPSIPDACQYNGYFPTSGSLSVPTEYNGLISRFFADKAATDLREDGRPVFSCYLTEFSTSQLEPTDKKPMWMRVKVQDYDAAGIPIASKWQYYKIDLASYNADGTPGETLNILRNNIYRYEVQSIGYELDLTLHVLDWTTQTVSWSYDNVPAVNNDGLLRWTVNGGALPTGMLNSTTATLTITNSDMLAGTFAFAQPIGGTWQATLVQGNKDTAINAFIFVDENGEEIKPPLPDVNPPANPSVSGYIDGKPAVIRIKAKNPPTDNDQEMRLIFTVTSLDGRMMSADLVGGRYGAKTYFTIQQNAKL